MSKLACIIFAALLMVGICTDMSAAKDASELSRIFEARNAAAKTGDVNKIISYYSAEQQKAIRKDIKKKEDRAFFLLISKAMVPESYETQHVSWSKDGKSASLYLLAQYAAMPEVERPRSRLEIVVNFKKEGSAWKIDALMPLADPDKIKRAESLTCEDSNADLEKSAEIGGRIVRTEYRDDHTMIILRVMDEEHVVCLAPKEVLIKAGKPLEDFQPWNLHEFSGFPHKTDKLKIFATGGRLLDE